MNTNKLFDIFVARRMPIKKW